MSSLQCLRELIRDRLTAAAEEIFRAVESTIHVFKEELEDQRKPHVAATSSRGDLRSLIGDRLNAAAAEILRASEKTVFVYKEALERHRSMLDLVYNPRVKLHRIDLPQQPDCEEELLPDQESSSSLESTHIKEDLEETSISLGEKPCLLSHSCPEDVPQQQDFKEEVLSDQYLSHQEGNSSLDHVEPESLHIKEDDDEIPISREEQQLVLKQETGTLTLTLDNRESGHHLGGGHQLLSLSSPGVKSQDQTGSRDVEKNTKAEEDLDYQQKLLGCSFQPYLKLYRLEFLQMTHPEEMRRDKGPNHHQSNIGLNTRKGKQSYKCETCGKVFFERYTLMRHLRIHTGEKPYSCEVCGKRFNQSVHLNVHMRTHTGEKPFSCETCGKCFSLNSSRVNHIRTHTGEKPHSCETCGKCFNLRYALKVHMRTHTGERLKPCPR